MLQDGTNRTFSLPVGIVVRRLPGVTRWAKWSWRAVAALPGAGPADWREMRRDGEAVEFHAATLPMELHAADAEAYAHGLSAREPALYVVMRPGEGAHPIDVLLITASPYEAQDYADSGEELVEKVPMPPSVLAFVEDFVATHHEEEEFVKRRRNLARIDLTQDGIGDARISQMTDVYRAPRRRKETLH